MIGADDIEEMWMKLLDYLEVRSQEALHRIEIFHGDLSAIPPEQAVDVLVVSAFPNNYRPSRGTLMQALATRGVSVRDLARNKAFDLRKTHGIWLSQGIEADGDDIGFKQVLCFEPRYLGAAEEVVGDIFQSLIPFVYGEPYIKKVAMPLVATGNQRVPLVTMLAALLDAAVNWLAQGLPVECIKIVEYDALKAAEIKGAFAVLKERYHTEEAPIDLTPDYTYDYFISYSRQNMEEVNFLYKTLKQVNPAVNIFLDKTELQTGVAWQQELFEALDDCRKVIAVFSPGYLESKVCKEEYNIALLRHRDTEDGILIPIYLYSAELPTYMRLIQFLDCREGHVEKIEQACHDIIMMA